LGVLQIRVSDSKAKHKLHLASIARTLTKEQLSDELNKIVKGTHPPFLLRGGFFQIGYESRSDFTSQPGVTRFLGIVTLGGSHLFGKSDNRGSDPAQPLSLKCKPTLFGFMQ